MPESTLLWIWGGLLVVFLVLEAATVQLVSIWFALGALGALIAALCGGSQIVQLIVFVVLSLGALAATRPLTKRFLSRRIQLTNVDRNIGATAVVLEEIDNLRSVGQVQVNGMVWTARSASDQVIPKNTLVRVEKIEGVKLIVSPQSGTAQRK